VANVSSMALVVSCIVIDAIRHPDDHNLIGVEVIVYCAFTVVSVGSGYLGSACRRLANRLGKGSAAN
jgi:hypothetical protein